MDVAKMRMRMQTAELEVDERISRNTMKISETTIST